MEAPLDADAVAVEPKELALAAVNWTPFTCLRPQGIPSDRIQGIYVLAEIRAFLAVVLIGSNLSAITAGMSAFPAVLPLSRCLTGRACLFQLTGGLFSKKEP